MNGRTASSIIQTQKRKKNIDSLGLLLINEARYY